MKRKILSVFLALCLMLSLLPSIALTASAADTWIHPTSDPGEFTVGDGSELNPYTISSAQALADLSWRVNNGNNYSGKYFKLAANIVLNDNVLAADGTLNSGSFIEWTPIGNSTSSFRGTFDGDGHTISGIYINDSSTIHQGLFGNISDGTIKNVGVTDSYISGGDRVAGIVGIANSSTIENCYNSGTIKGNDQVGGIVGYSRECTVRNCHNDGLINANDYSGGVVAYDDNYSSITNCNNTGAIKAAHYVGGIVGNLASIIINCFNTGEVTALNYAAGGIAGICGDTSTIKACFNTGNVYANEYYAGGIAAFTSDRIQLSYNCGNVTSSGGSIGGIIGLLRGTVENCYNAGDVTGTNNVGGVVGMETGATVTNCYYDKQMCTCMYGRGIRASSIGAEGKLTSEMVGAQLQDATASNPWGASNWVFTEGLYPRLANMDAADLAILFATPVFLSNSDTIDGVGNNFTVGTNGVSWTSGNTDVISLSGNNATLNKKGSNIVLTASLNGIEKKIMILAVNLYSVTYVASTVDDGSVPTNSTFYHPADSFSVAGLGDLTRAGYTFVGWKSGSSIYSAGDNYTVGNADITFNAVWKPDTPAAPTLDSKTDTSITVTGLSGQQYSKDNGTTWQDSGTFSGLTPNTGYSIITRVPAAGYDVASEVSDALTVTTKQSAAAAPVAPTLNSKTNTSIIVTVVADQEYSIDGGVTWQESGTFSGLTADTDYSICTRLKETDTALPSAVSGSLDVRTNENPAPVGGGSIVNNSPSSDDASDGADVYVNGEKHSAGESETKTENGKTITTVTVDSEKLEKVLETKGAGATITVPITTGSAVSSGVLTGQMVKNMETKDATLVVQTDSATYTLPAKEIDIDEVAGQFGEEIDLSDIEVEVTISEPDDSTVLVTENAAEDGGFTLIVQPVEFTVECSYKGKRVEIDSYNAYMERTIKIPDGVDPEKITTAVVVNADGTVRHVPTEIVEIDGVYYAVINSLTNSVYTLINNDLEFGDIEGHWAQDAINDMGSRMVINGDENGNFNPDDNITRAEFAAIIVRALGLAPGTGESGFGDISVEDWYCGSVKTASAYGIIAGYGDGVFGPNDTITREQVMAMIARAMKITGLEVSLSDRDIGELLADYLDGASVSDYAVGGIAACLQTGIVSGRSDAMISPNDYVTRAEVAVMVQRLLQKSELI